MIIKERDRVYTKLAYNYFLNLLAFLRTKRSDSIIAHNWLFYFFS